MTSNSDDRGATSEDLNSDNSLPPHRTALHKPAASVVALPSPHAFIHDALALGAASAGDDPPGDARALVIYQRTFPLGEGLADLLTRRAMAGQHSLGLAALIEDILEIPTQSPGDPGRRALFAGLCWRLEHLIAQGTRVEPELALVTENGQPAPDAAPDEDPCA